MKDTFDSGDEFEDDEDFSEAHEPEYHPEADDPGVFWCPQCGAEMYGDSTRCPKCGDFVTPGARPSTAKPWWMWTGIIIVALALLGALLAAAFH